MKYTRHGSKYREEEEGARIVLVGKPKGRNPPRKLRSLWENNIKIYPTK
jgi:hypothetical protein